MCLAPRVPSVPPPAPPPTLQDAGVRATRAQQLRRLGLSSGFRGTMLSPEARAASQAPATGQAKTLLGA